MAISIWREAPQYLPDAWYPYSGQGTELAHHHGPSFSSFCPPCLTIPVPTLSACSTQVWYTETHFLQLKAGLAQASLQSPSPSLRSREQMGGHLSVSSSWSPHAGPAVASLPCELLCGYQEPEPAFLIQQEGQCLVWVGR